MVSVLSILCPYQCLLKKTFFVQIRCIIAGLKIRVESSTVCKHLLYLFSVTAPQTKIATETVQSSFLMDWDGHISGP